MMDSQFSTQTPTSVHGFANHQPIEEPKRLSKEQRKRVLTSVINSFASNSSHMPLPSSLDFKDASFEQSPQARHQVSKMEMEPVSDPLIRELTDRWGTPPQSIEFNGYANLLENFFTDSSLPSLHSNAQPVKSPSEFSLGKRSASTRNSEIFMHQLAQPEKRKGKEFFDTTTTYSHLETDHCSILSDSNSSSGDKLPLQKRHSSDGQQQQQADEHVKITRDKIRRRILTIITSMIGRDPQIVPSPSTTASH